MPLPLIALAIGAGVARTGVGAWQNRRDTRRQRRNIQEAYRFSADNLAVDQNDSRQNEAEQLAARGLLQGGNPDAIARATELNSTDARITRPEDFKANTQEVRDPRRPYVRTRTPITDAMMPPQSAPTSLAGQTLADNAGARRVRPAHAEPEPHRG
jgi:hypothetical protein